MSAGVRRFPWLWYIVALVLLLVVTLFPVPLLYGAFWFAEANGCTISEAGVFPCIVNGTDWGSTLSLMSMSAWLLIATIPLMAGGVTILAIVLLIHRILWARKEQAE